VIWEGIGWRLVGDWMEGSLHLGLRTRLEPLCTVSFDSYFGFDISFVCYNDQEDQEI
jgi:hypothetical protein